MVTTTITYDGALNCTAVHGPSSASINTDAPKDNHGKGENFSPTDLVASALGSCILTVMGILAKRLEIDIAGATATVEKEMASAPERRIGALRVLVRVPHNISEDDRVKFERAAHTCPVHKSLHPDIEMPIDFEWG